jgi:hypothetical protein
VFNLGSRHDADRWSHPMAGYAAMARHDTVAGLSSLALTGVQSRHDAYHWASPTNLCQNVPDDPSPCKQVDLLVPPMGCGNNNQCG